MAPDWPWWLEGGPGAGVRSPLEPELDGPVPTVPSAASAVPIVRCCAHVMETGPCCVLRGLSSPYQDQIVPGTVATPHPGTTLLESWSQMQVGKETVCQNSGLHLLYSVLYLNRTEDWRVNIMYLFEKIAKKNPPLNR